MKMNQRVAITKKLLEEALLELLEKKPLERISITELCLAAGINRATFYRHYYIPKDVLADMQLQFVEKMQSKFNGMLFNQSPEAFVEALCIDLYESSAFIKIAIKNNMEDHIIALSRDAFARYLKENDVLRGRGALDDNDWKLLLAYMSGGSYFMIRQWLLEDLPKSPKEMSKMVLSFMDLGALTRL